MAAARLYVTIALWASSLLLARLVPVMLLAEVIVVVCVASLLHALVIAFTTWLYRKGDVRSMLRFLGVRTSRDQFILLVVTMGAWYLAAAIHDRRSPLNILVIEAVYGIGIWLYLRRATLRRELAHQLGQRLGSSRHT
jgi:hypothetical protein